MDVDGATELGELQMESQQLSDVQQGEIEAPWGSDGSPASSANNSPSRAATAGRWKNTTIEASDEAYREMDRVLNAFCNDKQVAFARALKHYCKRHNFRVPGDNDWNTYCKYHKHECNMATELKRVGETIEHFKTLGGRQQQEIRSKCYDTFKTSFPSKVEYGIALEVFTEMASYQEKESGISISHRHRKFNAMVRKCTKTVSIFIFLAVLNYLNTFLGRSHLQ